MVPPPDQMGDEFPDFDNMTIEEQMAWLETLAKRQGARDEELTTAADLDIPVPEDVEIDEPGYVPYSISEKPRERWPEADREELALEQDLPEELPEIMAEEAEDFEMAEAEAVDPMQWLDSLSAQPAEDLGDLDVFAEAADFDLIKELDDIFAEGAGEIEAAVPDSDLAAELKEAFDWDLESESEADVFEELEEVTSVQDDVELAEAATVRFAGAEMQQPEELVAASDDDPLGGLDPMLWLESLAARQGARTEEFTTAANLDVAQVSEDTVVDEPGYVPFEGSRSAREWQTHAAQVPEPELGMEPEGIFDLEPEFELGMEPEEILDLEPEFELDELESVLEFEEPDWEPEAALDIDGESVAEFLADDTVVAETTEGEASVFEGAELDLAEVEVDEEDLLSGADPMRWLESLAKRQGAKVEELTTAADLEIPELPEDTVIDEPGYTEYSPFGILAPDQAELAESVRAQSAPPPSMPEAEYEFEPEEALEFADESLSWLEDLAAEPDEDVSDFLAFDEPEEVSEPEVEHAAAAGDPLAGMSDEEIVEAQIKGLLTGEQELAWLKRQAAKLAEARESQEMGLFEVSEADVVAAEPGDLPPWLEAMREEQDEATPDEALLAEELDFAEVPDWLEEALPEDGLELEGLTEGRATELALDGDVESLWADVSDEEFTLQEETIPDSELAAFLEGDLVAEPDPLAEALDAEFERRLAGDESEPAWYTDAVAQTEARTDEEFEVEMLAEAESPVEAELAEAVPQDMPGWLGEADEELEPAVADSDMPDWLRESEPEAVLEDSDMPDWLTEEVEEPETVAEQDWLRAFDKEPEAEGIYAWLDEEEQVARPEPVAVVAPEPQPEKPAVPLAPVISELPLSREPASIPVGELFDTYRQRLDQDPADHASRLALARALRADQKLVPSLDQYEVLVESTQLLQDVSEDLEGLVAENPAKPRMQRLLGDVFMRQGKLQEALEAYRSALDHL